MITLKTVNSNLVAPVFFFIAIVAYVFTALCLLSAFSTKLEFLVVGCITFVLGYNAWLFGKDVKNR